MVVDVNMDGSASCLTFRLLSFLKYFASCFSLTAAEHRLNPSLQPATDVLGSLWLLFLSFFFLFISL